MKQTSTIMPMAVDYFEDPGRYVDKVVEVSEAGPSWTTSHL